MSCHEIMSTFIKHPPYCYWLMRMWKNGFVEITLSIDYWSNENWFAYNVLGIPNSERDWDILICQLAKRRHMVVKNNIQNCPILLGTKCFVDKRRVVSPFVPLCFSKIGLHPGKNLTFTICPIQILFDWASANLYPWSRCFSKIYKVLCLYCYGNAFKWTQPSDRKKTEFLISYFK